MLMVNDDDDDDGGGGVTTGGYTKCPTVQWGPTLIMTIVVMMIIMMTANEQQLAIGIERYIVRYKRGNKKGQ